MVSVAGLSRGFLWVGRGSGVHRRTNTLKSCKWIPWSQFYKKGESLFFLFLLSFHFPLYLLLSFTFLHLWDGGWFEKYEFRHSANPEESDSQGSGRGGGGCRAPAGPRVSGEHRLVSREPGALRLLGVRAGSQARKEGTEEIGRPMEPSLLLCGEGSPSAVQGDVAAEDLPVAQCPFWYCHIPIINCLQHVLGSHWNKKGIIQLDHQPRSGEGICLLRGRSEAVQSSQNPGRGALSRGSPTQPEGATLRGFHCSMGRRNPRCP